jgi:hypothetical protein
MLKFSKVLRRMLHGSERAIFLLFFSSLSLSTNQHMEFHSGALMQRWRGEWIFSLPSLSLSTNQFRGSQLIYLGISLSTGRCFDPTNQK